MKKKMLKTAGVLCLCMVLCISMVGCSGKENDQSNTPDVHTIKDGGSNDNVETSGAKDDSEENNSNGIAGNYEDTGNNSTESSSEMSDDSKEEGVFYDGANLSGRVVDFSDTGCTITPRTLIINEDGSMEGGIAAPGYESEETNIHITYAEDVVFQVIYFSMGSQTEISREDTYKNSVKKETDVNIFGTCQDDKNWIADKVVITRWQ